MLISWNIDMKNDELVELETKIAYQEDTIQTLNDALCNQQQKSISWKPKWIICCRKLESLKNPRWLKIRMKKFRHTTESNNTNSHARTLSCKLI